MTVQEAADVLNVSYEWILHLLIRGELVYADIDEEHYINRESVMEYKNIRDQERRQGLDELISLTEEIGGYDGES